MKRNKKSLLVIVTVFCLVLAIGCSKKSNTDSSPSASESPQAQSPSASASASATPEEKKTITLFMGDAGIVSPPNADRSDNPFINIVKNYANVDLKVEVPSYADFKTRLDLLLASGDLPDIVHDWYPADTEKVADQGAFIDLKKYYDNSPIVQKWVTPEMMELAKSASGHYYRLPMPWNKAASGEGLQVRYDLIQKYNDGIWPDSVDAWVEMFRKEKKMNPDSMPVGNAADGDKALRQSGIVIYGLYGAKPYEYRIQDGKAISTFETPEYREATTVMKTLFDEGILDKEFATTKPDDAYKKRFTKDVVGFWETIDQMTASAPFVAKGAAGGFTDFPNAEKWRFSMAPPLTKLPAVVKDVKYTWTYKNLPINAQHGIYISSNAKDPDRAWKTIEGFFTDELYQEIFWGKEGDTYTVKDGQRVPDFVKLNDPNHTWGLQYAMGISYVAAADDLNVIKDKLAMGEEYYQQMYDSIKPYNEQGNNKGFDFFRFAKLSEEPQRKLAESFQFISQATVQAIMGKITMTEFDQKVKEFQQKYGLIADDYTKYLNEHKDDLRSKGVISVDW